VEEKVVLKKRSGSRGSHCCQVVIRVSSWKPGSESLKGMMSLGDPNIRLQSTIWRSRGSRDAILKILFVQEWAVLSLRITKESE